MAASNAQIRVLFVIELMAANCWYGCLWFRQLL